VEPYRSKRVLHQFGIQQGILNVCRMVVHYYHRKHLPKDYELILDWTSDWETPIRDSDYEDDIDIDGFDHTEDYMAWWQEHRPH